MQPQQYRYATLQPAGYYPQVASKPHPLAQYHWNLVIAFVLTCAVIVAVAVILPLYFFDLDQSSSGNIGQTNRQCLNLLWWLFVYLLTFFIIMLTVIALCCCYLIPTLPMCAGPVDGSSGGAGGDFLFENPFSSSAIASSDADSSIASTSSSATSSTASSSSVISSSHVSSSIFSSLWTSSSTSSSPVIGSISSSSPPLGSSASSPFSSGICSSSALALSSSTSSSSSSISLSSSAHSSSPSAVSSSSQITSSFSSSSGLLSSSSSLSSVSSSGHSDSASLLATSSPSSASSLRTFYVSSSLGNDANAGTSPTTPWASLNKINSLVASNYFLPLDTIQVCNTDVFQTQQLTFNGTWSSTTLGNTTLLSAVTVNGNWTCNATALALAGGSSYPVITPSILLNNLQPIATFGSVLVYDVSSLTYPHGPYIKAVWVKSNSTSPTTPYVQARTPNLISLSQRVGVNASEFLFTNVTGSARQFAIVPALAGLYPDGYWVNFTIRIRTNDYSQEAQTITQSFGSNGTLVPQNWFGYAPVNLDSSTGKGCGLYLEATSTSFNTTALSILDSAGEWWHDGNANLLYVWPASAADNAALLANTATFSVVLSNVTYGVSIAPGSSFSVVLEHIAVARSTLVGILAATNSNQTSITLNDVMVNRVALGLGVEAYSNLSSNATIALQSSLIQNTDSSCVDFQLAAASSLVLHNTVQMCALSAGLQVTGLFQTRTLGGSGILSNGLISGNTISYTGFNCINPFSGSTVLGNTLSQCLLSMDGASAIDGGGQGQIIANNFINGSIGNFVASYFNSPQTGGINLEDSSANCSIFNNTVIGITSGACLGVENNGAWNNFTGNTCWDGIGAAYDYGTTNNATNWFTNNRFYRNGSLSMNTYIAPFVGIYNGFASNPDNYFTLQGNMYCDLLSPAAANSTSMFIKTYPVYNPYLGSSVFQYNFYTFAAWQASDPGNPDLSYATCNPQAAMGSALLSRFGPFGSVSYYPFEVNVQDAITGNIVEVLQWGGYGGLTFGPTAAPNGTSISIMFVHTGAAPVTANQITNSFAIAAWFKAFTIYYSPLGTSWQWVTSIAPLSAAPYSSILCMTSTSCFFYLSLMNVTFFNVSFTPTFNITSWNHFAFSYDDSSWTVSAWINGVPIVLNAPSPLPSLNLAWNSTAHHGLLTLGRTSPTGINGWLWHLYYWNTAISTGTVQSVFVVEGGSIAVVSSSSSTGGGSAAVISSSSSSSPGSGSASGTSSSVSSSYVMSSSSSSQISCPIPASYASSINTFPSSIDPPPALWLLGDAVAGSNGAMVPFWCDISYNAAALTAPYSPASLVTGLYNGHSAVRFNGSTSFFASAIAIVGGTFDFTVVMAIMPGNDIHGQAALLETSNYNLYLSSGNGFYYQYTGSPSFTVNGPSSPYNETAIIFSMTMVNATGLTQMFLNGLLTLSATVNNTITYAGNAYIGSAGNAQHYLGDILELLIFPYALPPVNRSAVESYLNIKYAIIPNSSWYVAYTTGTGYPSAAIGWPSFWVSGDSLVSLSGAQNGSSVSQWTDISGSGNCAYQLTTSSQPLLIVNASAYNNHSAVRFSASELLSVPGGIPLYSSFTFAVVANPFANASNVNLVKSQPSGNWSMYLSAGTNRPVVSAQSSFSASSAVVLNVGTVFFYAFVYQYSAGTLNVTQYVNGSFAGSIYSASNSGISTAAFNLGTDNFIGDFLEMLVLPAALNSTQMALLNTYLSNKYTFAALR